MADLDFRQVLAFEHRWFHVAGTKDEAIVRTFGCSPTVYHQRLNALIDTEEALAADPMLVKRLRRLRATRRALRAQREVRS